MPVDPSVQKGAGAIGAVSRAYRNSKTGEKVDLWLIVGHARDIAFHTPDVCYPASGFEARSKENSLYPMVIQGLPDAPFWTNTFYRESELSGRQLIRVFWSWFNPDSMENDGTVKWEAPGQRAPGNSGIRGHSTRCTSPARCTTRWKPPSKVRAYDLLVNSCQKWIKRSPRCITRCIPKQSAILPTSLSIARQRAPNAQAPVDETIGNAEARIEASATEDAGTPDPIAGTNEVSPGATK